MSPVHAGSRRRFLEDPGLLVTGMERLSSVGTEKGFCQLGRTIELATWLGMMGPVERIDAWEVEVVVKQEGDVDGDG